MKRVGLALGGGGARGYAHIPVLEVLDELGVRPHAIAGTSIGSILGAMYASGMSGSEIRRWVGEAVFDRDDSLRDIVRKREELWKWFDVLVPDFGGRGLVRSDRIVGRLLEEIRVSTFEQLGIPLLVVATDLWAGEQVVFRAGELLPAVRASMAVPGVFAPVTWAGRVLVDGGLVNLVPYDLLQDDCDLTIAVNVGRHPRPPPGGAPLEPKLFDLLRYSIDLMQLARFKEQARQRPPDILVEPDVGETRIFQFDRASEVMERAQPAAEQLRARLPAALAEPG